MFAPFIDVALSLVVAATVAKRVDTIVAAQLSADAVPRQKIKDIGGDSVAMADLNRYLNYGSRVGKTLEASILGALGIILSGYEHNGSFSISGAYLLVFLGLIVNVSILLFRANAKTIDGFNKSAALGHYISALALSLFVIALNIHYYP
jgi:hypothetical protein